MVTCGMVIIELPEASKVSGLSELFQELGFFLYCILQKRADMAETALSAISAIIARMEDIARERPWDVSRFQDEKGRPITTWLKGLLSQAWKEDLLPLSKKERADIISALLSKVPSLYVKRGTLEFTVINPYEEGWENFGDGESCFRPGGCNSGQGVWLQYGYEPARFVAMYHRDNDGNIISKGRFWLLANERDGVGFVLNIYSTGANYKDPQWKPFLVQGVRKLLGFERAKFKVIDEVPEVPFRDLFYLNPGGVLLVWNSDRYGTSEEVLQKFREGQLSEEWYRGRCLNCGKIFHITYLVKCEDGEEVYWKDHYWANPVVCEDCQYELEKPRICDRCGGRVDVIYEADGEMLCYECFRESFMICDRCGEPVPHDYVVTVNGRYRYGNYCERCIDSMISRGEVAPCDECGRYYPAEDTMSGHIVFLRNGVVEFSECTLCFRCEENYDTYKCKECGDITFISKEKREEILKFCAFEDDEFICPACVRKEVGNE